MIHLREKDKDAIRQIATECFKQKIEIWAYGSRVDGTNHDASDLDLVIRGPELKPLDFIELETFKDQVQSSQIPILVQAFDWAQLPDSFHKNILKKYEVLFSL